LISQRSILLQALLVMTTTVCILIVVLRETLHGDTISSFGSSFYVLHQLFPQISGGLFKR
jgi:hypothetical protein